MFVLGSILTNCRWRLVRPVWGTLRTTLGATTLVFLVARYAAPDWVSRTTGERMVRLMRGVEPEERRFVGFVRLVPLIPFNLVNCALGLTRIRLGEYAVTSFLRMAPGRKPATGRHMRGEKRRGGSRRQFLKG